MLYLPRITAYTRWRPFSKHISIGRTREFSCEKGLMQEIDWSRRLIGIKGSRGVGKTTFLLQYAKENFGPDDRTCLYINLNNLYFADKKLSDFVDEFIAWVVVAS